MKQIVKLSAVLICGVMLFFSTSCGLITGKIADAAKDKIQDQIEENLTEEVTENDTEDTTTAGDENVTDAATDEAGGDSTAITTSDGKGMDYPTDKMGNLPNIFPKITWVASDSSACSIAFEGLSKEDAEGYVDTLTSLGYTDGLSGEDSSGITFVKTDSAGNNVWFSYDPSNGTGALIYTPAAS